MAILFHRSVTGYQERTLHHRFGCAYAGYVPMAPRWIPRPPRHG
jgi:protein-S-isoprenylcysteine O-methyltransferase Ste14